MQICLVFNIVIQTHPFQNPVSAPGTILELALTTEFTFNNCLISKYRTYSCKISRYYHRKNDVSSTPRTIYD